MSIEAGWLKRTFNTRDRTETLLRPDFESGLITQHDYNLAVSFLPGPQRYYPVRTLDEPAAPDTHHGAST